ncbi:hypothetical protein SAMN02745157_4789 [Kaistia soli DSM 19436]|uniref:DUF1134 domain-containing protein n=1 Tax=Kaistia soli DSM 19436 TaxID=1122133 RepID=A0A1M5MHJ7_9HYPH|nr:DUF1134 domain-containing protein [Kaistia soli]SHG76808.1 hypothetical protein SAMN02745157_4789 [Kaistia soli DSM 19436]
MSFALRLGSWLGMLALAALLSSGQASAQSSEQYSVDEIVKAGGNFFGEISGGLASVVEHSMAQYGQPNGYVLGEQGSGALIAGVRYGQGTLYTKNAGKHPVFFQGPSIGWDFGGEGSKVMMLIYNLPSVNAIYDRFVGINGSAFLVGGVGMTVLSRDNIFVVPIVSGVGARLGVNVGYMKFTDHQTWNPF